MTVIKKNCFLFQVLTKESGGNRIKKKKRNDKIGKFNGGKLKLKKKKGEKNKKRKKKKKKPKRF